MVVGRTGNHIGYVNMNRASLKAARRCKWLANYYKKTATVLFFLAQLTSSLVPNQAAAEPGLVNPEPVSPYLNGVFPSTVPSPVVANGEAAWASRNYFPDVTFVELPIPIGC